MNKRFLKLPNIRIAVFISGLFFITQFFSCGLPETQQVLNTPSIATVGTTVTITHNRGTGHFDYYGICFYYKVFHHIKSDTTTVSTFSNDFNNIWNNTSFFGNPISAAATAKYFPLFLSSTDTTIINPTILISSSDPSTITADFSFPDSVEPKILLGKGTLTDPNDSNFVLYFRQQLRSSPNERKFFIASDFASGDIDYPSDPAALDPNEFCIGVIAYAYGQNIGESPQYSLPVTVGLFNLLPNSL